MLIGKLAGPRKKKFPPAVEKALAFLETQDFTVMQEGERYEIDGGRCYATIMRYNTRPVEECVCEAHRRFMDILYMVEGEEYLGICPMSPDLVVRTPYDETRDVEFFEGLVPESTFPIMAGDFVMLSPKDVHRPFTMIEAPSPVTKVIIKLDLALLDEHPSFARKV
ncbi:MAG: YhcH/YjgK/YiaL family protein [Schwartzia sp.]|nr:YhcH/YjgK/YiaL family protein [Schwartzia sp. (in: firmicutes)]